MNRRDFIKLMTGAAVVGATTAVGCDKISRHGDATQNVIDGTGTMTYRVNPNTGDKVSLLGYGMMRLPVEGGGAARENPDSPIDQELVNKQVDYALEHGVNYFDTSPVYCKGLSERSTGIALSRHPRDAYFIATKMSNFGPETWPAKASKLIFENSLKELQTDYVDYLLLHGVGMPGGGKNGMEAFYGRFVDNGILDWLVEQKNNGRIRNLGFSYHGDVAVFDMLLRWHNEGKYHWDFAQIELNYLDWEYANEINPRNTDAVYLYEELHKRGIMAVIMEPLLGGRLASLSPSIMARLQTREPQSSAARWAFRYAGTPQGVLTVLSGMTYMEHLIENVNTYSPLRPLSDDENRLMMLIAKDVYELKAVPCTACNYCMPCPYGIDIPGNFQHYNKSISDDTMPPHDCNAEQYKALRKKFLADYDRRVPKLRQANHCIGCNHCVQHCPQSINIPAELQRIDNFVEYLKQHPA